MRYLLAFFSALALLAATPYAFAQESETGCKPTFSVLEEIHEKKIPIVQAFALKDDKLAAVLKFVGLVNGPFNYVVLAIHPDKMYSLHFGTKEGDVALLCAGFIVPPQAVPGLLALIHEKKNDGKP